ncbi:MAG: hypothetical protein FWD23_16500, partial [Oscillospiraceae bacterium]|nr:hypothetical protein [Oscillospiraceae bacterium]
MNNDINFPTPGDNPEDVEMNGLNGLDGLNNLNNGGDEPDGGLPESGIGENLNVNYAEEDDAEAATKEEIDEAVNEEKHRLRIDDFSISGIWRGLKEYWLGLKRITRIFAVSSAALLLIAIVALTVILNRSPYVKTFVGLESDREAAEIMELLKDNKIPFKYDKVFRTISIKEKDEAAAVMAAVNRGYPQSGVLYEEEVSSNILESQQEKKERELRNKQKRLEAALRMMTGIELATVNLYIPDNSKAAITREIQPSTASVMLYTKTGYVLPPETVKGIENMIQK